MFWLFRGQAEGVSSSRERGAEDSYPSQRDETTVWDCKTDYWFKLFVLGNQAIQGYKKLYFLSFFFVEETGSNRFWWEKGNQQKEANDSWRESKYLFEMDGQFSF